jgi:hypothetical protein
VSSINDGLVLKSIHLKQCTSNTSSVDFVVLAADVLALRRIAEVIGVSEFDFRHTRVIRVDHVMIWAKIPYSEVESLLAAARSQNPHDAWCAEVKRELSVVEVTNRAKEDEKNSSGS